MTISTLKKWISPMEMELLACTFMIENCFSSTFYSLCLSLTNILHLFLGGSFLINSGHPNHLQITPGQSNVMCNVSCDLYFIFRLYSVLPWSFHCSKVFIPHGKLDLLTHQVCSLILWALHLATCQHYFASPSQLQRRAKGRSIEPMPRASYREGRPM